MRQIGPVNAVQLGTLIKVVQTMHDVPAERLPALKGRFRNFLKLGLPAVRAVGTGSRAEYWPDHVAQTLVAFELVRLRMPQSAAAHCVQSSLAVVGAAFGEAASLIAGGRARAATVMTVASNVLLEDAKLPEFGELSLEPKTGSLDDVAKDSGAVLAIDARGLIERAAQAARLTDEPFDAGFFIGLDQA